MLVDVESEDESVCDGTRRRLKQSVLDERLWPGVIVVVVVVVVVVVSCPLVA